ncbi:hypothetical protein [Paraburkholderia sp. J10-1]|uniref:hypothetical protein n=1 Tax=Paraburkholderia sp. J10-1 TaxID=2805430 RepID=UPI002AB6E019|nr:hypothetical protein [Paraburkholderia sp. J10-1]
METPIAERQKLGLLRLSAHEMAALMLLDYAPVEVDVEDPDMTVLRDAGLAQRTDHEPGRQEFSITREGIEMLRVLSMRTARKGIVGRPAPPGVTVVHQRKK